MYEGVTMSVAKGNYICLAAPTRCPLTGQPCVTAHDTTNNTALLPALYRPTPCDSELYCSTLQYSTLVVYYTQYTLHCTRDGKT